MPRVLVGGAEGDVGGEGMAGGLLGGVKIAFFELRESLFVFASGGVGIVMGVFVDGLVVGELERGFLAGVHPFHQGDAGDDHGS